MVGSGTTVGGSLARASASAVDSVGLAASTIATIAAEIIQLALLTVACIVSSLPYCCLARDAPRLVSISLFRFINAAPDAASREPEWNQRFEQ
jgi:hypothetical protein